MNPVKSLAEKDSAEKSQAISPVYFLRLFGMRINKEASDKAFGKVDLDYFVQSGIENAANEEELDAEVKIFQNALDFSNIKIRAPSHLPCG